MGKRGSGTRRTNRRNTMRRRNTNRKVRRNTNRKVRRNTMKRRNTRFRGGSGKLVKTSAAPVLEKVVTTSTEEQRAVKWLMEKKFESASIDAIKRHLRGNRIPFNVEQLELIPINELFRMLQEPKPFVSMDA